MSTSLHSADDNSSAAATIHSVDALSQLLAMNSAIEQARAEIDIPFSLSANRVTERANQIGRHRLRSVGAPTALAMELGRAAASMSGGLAGADALGAEAFAAQAIVAQAIVTEPFAAEGLGR